MACSSGRPRAAGAPTGLQAESWRLLREELAADAAARAEAERWAARRTGNTVLLSGPENTVAAIAEQLAQSGVEAMIEPGEGPGITARWAIR